MPHKKNLTATSVSISVQLIERRIYLIRGQKVMIDFDLAELYGVPTKRLNQQVTRNKTRFPEDFMFRLTREEAENLRSQFATSRFYLKSEPANASSGYGGRRYLPYAFTEQGVAMLSSVLNSDQSIEVNIAINASFCASQADARCDFKQRRDDPLPRAICSARSVLGSIDS